MFNFEVVEAVWQMPLENARFYVVEVCY